MKIIDRFIGLFEETEEELEEEIKKEEENIKKLGKTKQKSFPLNLFAITKEESKELIKESKERIQILKEDITDLKKRKKKKTIKKNISRKQKSFLFILALIIFASFVIINYNFTKKFSYSCEEPNPCIDCKAAISCPKITEENGTDYLWITAENRNNIIGDCNLIIKTDNKNIEKLGILNPNEKKIYKFQMEMPNGLSDFNMEIKCDW